jgi:AbrB family looped-hinge helix DNA binding protein
METAIISAKFKVVIPQKIREQFHLIPGQKLAFIPIENSLRLVVVPEIESAFGFLKGIDTNIEREE